MCTAHGLSILLLYSLWIVYIGVQIVIVDVGGKDSNYQQFVEKLPEKDCRFAGKRFMRGRALP